MPKTKDVCAFLRKNRVGERIFCALMLLFPILHAAPHPTATVGGTVLLLLLTHTAERGAKDFLPLRSGEVLVWLFCAALILYGLVGYGHAVDGLIVAVMIAAYLPVRDMLADPSTCRRARLCTSIGVGVTAVYGCLQYFFGNLSVRWVDMRLFSDIGGRVTSFFSNPNILAVYLLFCFPLAPAGAVDRKTPISQRVLCGASAAMTVLCTVLTWTRGAWLGMMVQGVLFLTLHSRRTRKILLALPLLLPFAALTLPPQVLRRFLSIGSLADSSNLYRIHTWRGVLRMLAAHPWGIGVGERAFRRIYPAHAVMGTETVMHAHNVFLQVACELGVAGGILFLVLVVHTLWRARRSTRVLPLAGLAVMGLFDHLWYAPTMAYLFACALALALTTPQKDTERQENVSILHEKL